MKAAILAILRQQEDSDEYTWGPTVGRLQALFDARNTPASEASTKREHPTPRTDAWAEGNHVAHDPDWLFYAHTLERELSETTARLTELQHAVWTRQALDESRRLIDARVDEETHDELESLSAALATAAQSESRLRFCQSQGIALTDAQIDAHMLRCVENQKIPQPYPL